MATSAIAARSCAATVPVRSDRPAGGRCSVISLAPTDHEAEPPSFAIRLVVGRRALTFAQFVEQYGLNRAAKAIDIVAEHAIDFRNAIDGDIDLEENGDHLDCSGDESDVAWPEGDSRQIQTADRFCEEDVEEDDDDQGIEDDPRGCDPEEDCCPAWDDR